MADTTLTTWRRAWCAVQAVPLLPVAGLYLIMRGQWLWFEHLDTVRPGGVPVMLGIGLLLLGMRKGAPGLTAFPPFGEGTQAAGWRLGWRALLIVVGLAVCVVTGLRAVEETRNAWTLLAMWAGGIALTTAGCVPWQAARAWGAMVRASWHDERRTWLLIGLLLLVSLAARTIDLETVPFILSSDDAQFAQEAVHLKDDRGWNYNPFQMGMWHHPRIVHTLMAVSIEALGQTATAARLPWAIFGALTVPATYLLARRLFDARVGWCAALIVATLPVHLLFSRIAMDMTGDGLFMALTFAFLARALRENDLLEAALAGLCLGLSQYFYFAGRIAALVVLGWLVVYALYNWRALWQRWGVILTLAIVAAGVVFPNLYAVYDDKERPLNPRLAHVSIWATGNLQGAVDRGELKGYLVDQSQKAFLGYVHFQDESDVYGRYHPLLGWYAGVPFLVGVAVVARKWRDPRFLLLAGWITGTAFLGGFLLVDPPHFPRYVNAIPALASVAGLGMVWFAQKMVDGAAALWTLLGRKVRAGRGAWARYALPVGLALVLAVANQLSFSFGYLPRTPEILYGEATRQLNDAVEILDTFEGRYAVWRFSTLELDLNGTSLLYYLTPENAGREYTEDLRGWRDVLAPGPTAFVIASGRMNEVIRVLMSLFPGGELHQYDNERTGVPLLYVYFADVPDVTDDSGNGQDSDA
ncbi:MAG: glycosyltransferase family 39 protein [Anaerolineae bacterium]|nr:glycosyltransferase family 39 protein [Anaerolineae bacterium]